MSFYRTVHQNYIIMVVDKKPCTYFYVNVGGVMVSIGLWLGLTSSQGLGGGGGGV